MIKKLNGKFDYIRTDLSMPVLSDSFIKQHVSENATLYKVVDEPVFITDNIMTGIMSAMMNMIIMGASQSQSVLVVLVGDGRDTIKRNELARIWENLGGVAVVIAADSLEDFLKEEDAMDYTPRSLREQFVHSVPEGIALRVHDIDGLSVIGALQKLVHESTEARRFLGIPKKFDGIPLSIVE
jgi:hypothetical protein